jgi:hypothetical protein
MKEGIQHIEDPSKRTFISALLKKVSEEYEDALISFVVFGSVARGDASSSSDLDLLLVLDTGECFFDRARRLGRLVNRIRKDVIAKNAEECIPSLEIYPLNISEATGFRPIYLDLCFDAVIIYDKNSFFRRNLIKLREALSRLGSKRLRLPGGRWMWLLKPDLKLGEEFRIGI